MTSDDEVWMRRALELAERGRGFVEPNPLVGAVLVRDGKLIGEGYHRKCGEAHAEINALAAAGEAARGATLYVTLEPCCHFGKTPPCTDAVLRAEVGRVVAAMADPFTQVAGKGASILRAAGIPVELGLCEPEARRLNAPYLKLVTVGQPYVHAKWAMTLDGKICTRTGDSRWISNEASRTRVHQLRGRMDAIIVGIGTALADDPLLTARPAGARTACRIVLDDFCRLPVDSQLVRTAQQHPVLVVAKEDNANAASLRKAGCEVLILGQGGLPALLNEMGRRRWTNVLVEGGSAILGNFFDLEMIDEAHVFLAPVIVGGHEAKTPVGGVGFAKIAEAMRLTDARAETLDGNIYLHGYLRRS